VAAWLWFFIVGFQPVAVLSVLLVALLRRRWLSRLRAVCATCRNLEFSFRQGPSEAQRTRKPGLSGQNAIRSKIPASAARIVAIPPGQKSWLSHWFD
jgi:hypothetical protein